MLRKVNLWFLCLLFFILFPTVLSGQELSKQNCNDNFVSENFFGREDDLFGRERLHWRNPFQTDDFNVRFLGNWPFGPSYAVALNGNHVYLGSGGGIYVLNISNPAVPIKIAEIKTKGWVVGLSTSGSYLYVADYRSGLLIYDISNPTSPYQVGSYENYSLNSVIVAGDNVYSTDLSSLIIIDISDPASSYLVGSYLTTGYPEAVAISAA